MAIEIAAAVKSAEELDKAAGIIAKVVSKLKAQPDIAAQKLSQALGEVAKTLQVVDAAASQFLSLGIDEGALAKNSKLLLEIDGGSLSTEIARGRGHCHLIEIIYRSYLDKWFSKALNAAEYDSVHDVFQRLGVGDQDLFDVLAGVATELEKEADAVLDLVLKGDESGARTRVLSALPILRPLRKAISRTMQTLYAMEEEFIEITR